jgi:hypothetical protein
VSDNWQVGDLAVCINDEWDGCLAGNPRRGDILRVSKSGYLGDVFGLGFYGKNQRHGWSAEMFRKIRPDTEPCDAEFTALIKRGVLV